jgi:hypothetical protein
MSPQRTPPEVLDAIATTCHSILCMSQTEHSWRDHSGTGYRDLGKRLMAEIEERGYRIERSKP